MTRLCKLTLTSLALLLSAFNHASAATPAQPKVVFIGDQYTYDWPLNNSNWINKGSPGIGLGNYNGDSNQVLARFQTDVVALHPQIVHIMIGSVDAAEKHDSTYTYAQPSFVSSLQALIKAAAAAKIQVILGLEPQYGTINLINEFDNAVVTVGAANNIAVINYGDALCGCVTSIDGGPVGQYNSLFNQPTPNGGIPEPAISATGYALMSQMAAAAIATSGATIKGGYLQDVELQNETSDNKPVVNTNTVPTGVMVQFTPVGLYTNGSYQNVTNTNYYGASGGWISSNPLVMYVNEQGLAYAMSGGTTNITYTAPNGVKFSLWTMHVEAPSL